MTQTSFYQGSSSNLKQSRWIIHKSLSSDTTTNESSTVRRFLKRSSSAQSAARLWHCHWSHYPDLALGKAETIQLTLLKLLTCFADFVHESESAVTSTLVHPSKLTSVSDFWVHLFLSGKKGCWFCRTLWSAESPSVQQVSSYLNCHELACTLSPAKPRRKQQVWVRRH